jgi:hypothetical protein
MVFFHSALILANAAIVIGGSYLAGADYTDPSSPDTQRRLRISKITRTTGQSVFLAGNALLLGIILVTMRNNRRDGDPRRKKGTVHPTLWLLFIAWFPLIVRGIFGILQASVFSVRSFSSFVCSPLTISLFHNTDVPSDLPALILQSCVLLLNISSLTPIHLINIQRITTAPRASRRASRLSSTSLAYSPSGLRACFSILFYDHFPPFFHHLSFRYSHLFNPLCFPPRLLIPFTSSVRRYVSEPEYLLIRFPSSCVLLNLTYLTSKNDPKKRDIGAGTMTGQEDKMDSEGRGEAVLGGEN